MTTYPNLSQKPEDIAKSINRMRGTPEWRDLMKFIQGHLEHVQTALVNAPPADVPALQGRARALMEILKL